MPTKRMTSFRASVVALAQLNLQEDGFRTVKCLSVTFDSFPPRTSSLTFDKKHAGDEGLCEVNASHSMTCAREIQQQLVHLPGLAYWNSVPEKGEVKRKACATTCACQMCTCARGYLSALQVFGLWPILFSLL